MVVVLSEIHMSGATSLVTNSPTMAYMHQRYDQIAAAATENTQHSSLAVENEIPIARASDSLKWQSTVALIATFSSSKL